LVIRATAGGHGQLLGHDGGGSLGVPATDQAKRRTADLLDLLWANTRQKRMCEGTATGGTWEHFRAVPVQASAVGSQRRADSGIKDGPWFERCQGFAIERMHEGMRPSVPCRTGLREEGWRVEQSEIGDSHILYFLAGFSCGGGPWTVDRGQERKKSCSAAVAAVCPHPPRRRPLAGVSAAFLRRSASTSGAASGLPPADATNGSPSCSGSPQAVGGS
jgi:hypothetical protein